MRRLLGSLVLVPVLLAGLTACGGDGTDSTDGTADDPAPTTSSSTANDPTTDPPATATDDPTTVDPTLPPTAPPTKSPPLTPGGVPFELVTIVSGTAAGGEATSKAVPIATEKEATAYARSFTGDLVGEVTNALAGARRGGQSVYAQVVGTGCDVPPGVDVSESGGDIVITGQKVPDPTLECFAPVTSVAIVAITG